MFSKPIKDCGCGGGTDCVTKNKKEFRAWVCREMKRLDCGCGCKGKTKFEQKYGKLTGAGVLADCPPGWRNDGLTCVEPCKPDEYDDGLTCRKKCEPGFINDGLTCRKPITSSMNSCPDGSKDIAGTCWGPVRKDCIDDCFKHPAPGCKTVQCGRLRGVFGEDWGPKWCTSCNLRCGQTCWDVQGITKHLHQRELKLFGGEVIAQAIRSKQIRGRVNFNELLKVMEQGLKDLLAGNIDLAAAFDPERNGVNAAFRKFGDDIKGAMEEISNKIKEGFKKMGDDARRAFEELARNAETTFKQFGEDFVRKMKDPNFWIEAAAILAEVALYAAAMALTVTGVGAGAVPGLLAAAAMAGPSIRIIGKAAQGQSIDALDIAELAIAGASAAVPGLSGITQNVVKGGVALAQVVVAGVKAGQSLGIIPSSCLGPNCPVRDTGERDSDPPLDPAIPGKDIEGQKTYKEISDLQPAHTIKYKIKGVINPDYIFEADWVAQYRKEHYGDSGVTEDEKINRDTDIPITEDPNKPEFEEFPPMDEGTDFPPKSDADFSDDFPNFGEGTDFPPNDFPDLPDSDFPDFGPGTDFPPKSDADFGSDFPDFGPGTDFPPVEPEPETKPEVEPEAEVEAEVPETKPEETQTVTIPEYYIGDEDFESEILPKKLSGGTNPEDLPLVEVKIDGDTYSNPWGTMTSTLPKSNIPKTKSGKEFNPKCYAENNPDVAKAVGDDPGKLTTHWIEIGHKEYDADCGGETEMTKEEKEKQEKEILEGRKNNCKITNRFWVEADAFCDGHRNADGSINTAAEQCKEKDGLWSHSNKYNTSFCNEIYNHTGKLKSLQNECNAKGNYWNDKITLRPGQRQQLRCDRAKNPDGVLKTESDVCTTLNAFWNNKTNKCEFDKNIDGIIIDDKTRCINNNLLWDPSQSNPNLRCNADRTADDEPQTGGLDETGKHRTAAPIFLRPNNNAQIEMHYNDIIAKIGKSGSGKIPSLTLYWAEWCPHCHTIMPEWKKLGSNYKGIKIEAIEEKQSKIKMDGYPTIIFRNGKRMEKYEGPRTKTAIIKFLKNKLTN
jgi:thiol-disulfide isomerase/thioredoxin